MYTIDKNNVTYIVKEDEGKVIAFAENTKYLFINYVLKKFPFFRYILNADECEMPNKFVAVASLNVQDGDKWDEKIGKMVAYDKLKKAIDKSFFKRASKLCNKIEAELEMFVDDTNEYGEKLFNNQINRQKYIESLIKENA